MANLKRKQRIDLTDEINWCTLYIRNLSLPLYVIRFGYTSKHLAHMHYMEIISKHLEDEELVEQFKAWKTSSAATEFWRGINSDANVKKSTDQYNRPIDEYPIDTQWCMRNRNNLTFETFANHFGLTDEDFAYTRYQYIIEKYMKDDLLQQQFKEWKDSSFADDYWHNTNIKSAVRNTHRYAAEYIRMMAFNGFKDVLHLSFPNSNDGTEDGPPSKKSKKNKKA